MSEQPLESATQALPTQTLPAQHFEMLVKQVAWDLSVLRKLEGVSRVLEHLLDIPSSDEERLKDWQNACDFVCLKIIDGADGDIAFEQIEPASYQFLEESWLENVKQLKAYFIWRTDNTDNSTDNYFKASSGIRKQLLWREPAPPQDFEKVKAYLEEQYLANGNNEKLDDEKSNTKALIWRKARRTWETTGQGDEKTNWFRAKLYAALFYENIIGAVVNDDKQKTVAVLKAFQFSEAPANRFSIINGFETAIAINFLNKDIVREVLKLKRPKSYDSSMALVDDWPSRTLIPNLKYDKNDKRLTYDGVMRQADKEALLAVLAEERHRQAVESLFEQSQLRPTEATVI
jgi:hypothetical protein